MYQRILVSVDGGATSNCGRDESIRLARPTGFDASRSQSFGERVCDGVVAQAGHWSSDLIVIGTHGCRGPRRLAGSTAAADAVPALAT